EERSPSPFPSPPGRGDSFGNGRFFGATLGRESAPGYKREALLPSAQWISKPTPSPFPNGFPSPPRVSFPRRDVRFAKCGPPFRGGEGEGGDGSERRAGTVGDLRNKTDHRERRERVLYSQRDDRPHPNPMASQARHESVSREGTFASRNVVPQERGQLRERHVFWSDLDREAAPGMRKRHHFLRPNAFPSGPWVSFLRSDVRFAKWGPRGARK